MGRYQDYIDSLKKQTEDKITFLFDILDGFPVDTKLREPNDNTSVINNLTSAGGPQNIIDELNKEGDETDPDAMMDEKWKKFFEKDPTNPNTGNVLSATYSQWKRLDQEIRNLQSIASLTPQQQAELNAKNEAKQDLERIFPTIIRFTADVAQWAHYYIRSIATDYRVASQNPPLNPSLQQKFDSAVEAALSFFPKITNDPTVTPPNAGQITPVRWSFTQSLGDLYVPQGQKGKNGYFEPSYVDTNSYVRTDLSREAIARPLYALWELYRSTSDQNVQNRIKDAVLGVLEELRKNEYKAHYAPKSRVFFSKSTQIKKDPRISIPRIFLSLFPQIDQIDALFGGDHMFVYSFLRIGGEMGLQAGSTGHDAGLNYSDIADKYFNDHRKSFELTTTGLFYRFAGKSIRAILSDLLDIVMDVAGGALLNLILLWLLLVLLLALIASFIPIFGGLVGLIAILLLLAPAIIGIVLWGINGSKKLDLLAFRDLYHAIGLESDTLSVLLQLDSSRQAPKDLWHTKMLQILTLERRKVDPLFQAYFATTDAGQSALSIDLDQLANQVQQLQNRMRQSARGLPGSMSQFLQASAAYMAARQSLDFAYRLQNNVWREVPEKIIRAHYGHSYGRDPEAHNASRDIGMVRIKIDYLYNNIYPLTLGNTTTNLQPITKPKSSISIPQSFPIVKRASDFGDVAKIILGSSPKTVQHLNPAPAEYWANRTHVLSMSPYRFSSANDNIHWAAGEFHLCISKLLEEGHDIVTEIDNLNP